MENLGATLIIATVLILLALAMLTISYFITGKSNLKPGACGKVPNKKKDDDCGDKSSCELCKKPDNEK